MDLSAFPRIHKVVFIMHDGQITTLEMQGGADLVHRARGAGHNLRAKLLVVRTGDDAREMLPVWGVYDTRPGREHSHLVKAFTAATNDAAVMYALHVRGS